ncbi:HesB/IscA family protein [Ruania alba]|uniref:Fe-S cluster assembly iron-binding protein IscA n=1 Tax=Ruania alba TaxID=648782 RepID=A0A1H5MFH9_9MICO|nr:iron-sulfur cluster biosynthesis family protein [Ruania alba]SEE88142.1 Fe-S cluster assembly iron-binding protein IscA [Ruania alba]
MLLVSVYAEGTRGSVMLTLTENAQTAIKSITEQAGLPAEGGVRIAMAESGTELQMSLVPEPAESDQVIENEGARVFVAPETSELLDTQQLDASQTEEGTGFSLAAQEGAAATE